jgi:hypothetical protein
MSVSPHDRVSAIFTTVASAVCCAPEPPRSAKFNSRRDNPFLASKISLELNDLGTNFPGVRPNHQNYSGLRRRER